MERDRTTLEYVRFVVEKEGFDNAFSSYSHFEEVKDEEFHRLREAYLAAGEELADYLGVERLG